MACYLLLSPPGPEIEQTERESDPPTLPRQPAFLRLQRTKSLDSQKKISRESSYLYWQKVTVSMCQCFRDPDKIFRVFVRIAMAMSCPVFCRRVRMLPP